MKIKVIVTIFLLFLIFGCYPFSTTGDDGYGTVRFEISEDIIEGNFKYILQSEMIEIDFITGPNEHESIQTSVCINEEISLKAGLWEAEIIAFDSSSNIIASDKVDFTVKESEVVDVSVNMSPYLNPDCDSAEEGKIFVVLDWSTAGMNIISAVSDATAFWGQTESDSEQISSGLDKSRISEGVLSVSFDQCTSGFYQLAVNLFDDNGTVLLEYIENISVYDCLSGSAYITLESDDFNVGTSDISIILNFPETQELAFNYPSGYFFSRTEISEGITVTITGDSNYDSYDWSLYGYTLDSNSDSIVLPSDLDLGVHQLTVFVGLDGGLYSETFMFTVQE